MTVTTVALTYPPDIDAAYESWGANCGPCALAALLGCSVFAVHPLFHGFDRRPYVNPTHMKVALDEAGVSYLTIGPKRPTQGLVFLQWSGHEAKPIKVQYRYTHWISVHGNWVFEVNAPHLVTWAEWQRVMPRLIQEAGKGNGGFFIRSGIEVTP